MLVENIHFAVFMLDPLLSGQKVHKFCRGCSFIFDWNILSQLISLVAALPFCNQSLLAVDSGFVWPSHPFFLFVLKQKAGPFVKYFCYTYQSLTDDPSTLQFLMIRDCCMFSLINSVSDK